MSASAQNSLRPAFATALQFVHRGVSSLWASTLAAVAQSDYTTPGQMNWQAVVASGDGITLFTHGRTWDMIRRIEDRLIRQKWVLFPVIIVVLGYASGCGKSEKPTASNQSNASSTSGPTKVSGQPTTTASGLQYWDIIVGTGATAIPGKPVSVHYTGWLTNGDKFDSSLDRGKPFVFPLGEGQVIKGWDEGVTGMKAGGKRQLRIPPALGYGDTGAGGVIPPKATLIFDVELLEVGK